MAGQFKELMVGHQASKGSLCAGCGLAGALRLGAFAPDCGGA